MGRVTKGDIHRRREAAARRQDREAADQARLEEAVERAAMARISSELTKALVSAGHAIPEPSPATAAERDRVAGLIRRDRVDRVREQDRQLAELEVRDGVFVNLDDTVVEPTPEWTEKGDVRGYTPRQTDGTVRTVRTVRRVQAAAIIRLLNDDKLGAEEFAACIWYRNQFDAAGLDGRYSSSQFSATGSVQRSVKTGGFAGHMPLHQAEAEARANLRAVRKAMSTRLLPLLEGVVVHDLSLRNAALAARLDNSRSMDCFRAAVATLLRVCGELGIDFSSPGSVHG